MLSILGERRAATCDGSRRQFLKLGGLTLGGLTLPQILQYLLDRREPVYELV